MAKKQLTIEEKLQAALVPVEEQPYKVPENWCWVRLGAVVGFERGITFPAASKESVKREGNIYCVRTANIQEELELDNGLYVDEQYMKGNHSKLVKTGDIILSSANSRELVGKSVFVRDVPFPMTFGGFVLNVRPNESINNKLVFLYLRLQFLLGNFIVGATQTTNIANINTKQLGEYKVSLPPVQEQSRIVARIESLFAKLDEAKEKIQEVLDGAELRKAAILHQAFTGKLTEKWRKKRKQSFYEWKTMQLEDCFDIIGGIQKKPSRVPDKNPIPYITVANVYRDRIDVSELRYFEIFDGELEKYQLKHGDILIVEGNGSGSEIGRCAIWREELPICVYQNHIIRARRKTDNIIPEYVLYYLNSPMGISIMQDKARTTAGLYNLSTGKIKSISIPKPPADEQQEIICQLDKLLSYEQSTITACESALATIDKLKKSILARAFRGELGTNDPSEASAKELLQEILAS